MMTSEIRSRLRVAPILAMLLLALGCQSHTPLGPIRATMVAPDLEYLPPAQVRSAMWVLAAEVQYLERLMTKPTETERNTMQTAVLGTLERMQAAARTLDEPGRSSQRHVINQNIGRFLGMLERARRNAKRDPPNYFPASAIAGSCSLCHGAHSGTAMVNPQPAHLARVGINRVD